MSMRVSVFGLGYVGTVTAACLAKAGHRVIGVDVNAEKVSMISAGESPLVEPGLADLLAAVVSSRSLRTTTSAEDAVAGSDIALVCVGTPSRPNGQPDVTALRRVVEQIGAALRQAPRSYTVVIRSTVLPGTTQDLLEPMLREAAGEVAGRLVSLAVNPEFMREGSSLKDFFDPPLTLIGAEDDVSAATVLGLYAHLEAPVVHTDVRTAEMAKYVSNAFHALKVCFANEIADVCAALGANAQEVARIFMMDRKLNISEAYLRPGFAFGGSCLPKDLRALVHAAVASDIPVPLLSAITPSNETQIRRGIEAVLATRSRRIGVVGLSFKPATDDLRESPLVRVVEALIGKGCDVRILDSSISLARLRGANRKYIEEEIPHISSLLCDSPTALLEHADTVVIGNRGAEAEQVLRGVRPGQSVVDLTRSFEARST